MSVCKVFCNGKHLILSRFHKINTMIVEEVIGDISESQRPKSQGKSQIHQEKDPDAGIVIGNRNKCLGPV